MEKNTLKNKRKYGYNIELEYALRRVLGKKYYGYASTLSNPKEVKKGLIELIKVLEKRVNVISHYDLRLQNLLNSHLGLLKTKINNLSSDNSEIHIITELIHLIGILFCYDYDGKLNREVLFWQTPVQSFLDEKNALENNERENFKFLSNDLPRYQKEIIFDLKKKKVSIRNISKILNISEYKVRQYLK